MKMKAKEVIQNIYSGQLFKNIRLTREKLGRIMLGHVWSIPTEKSTKSITPIKTTKIVRFVT